MRIVRTITELREALAAEPRRDAVRQGDHGRPRDAARPRVGMVPTMGALHEGHLSLVRAARAENDIVVMSIFVNPKQFDEAADLAAYPRQEERDAALAESAGVDLIFAPDAAELYPAGFATTVSVTGVITDSLEGASRGSSHFDGVATVVAKLLIAALPDRAYFGEKDAQQLVVVRRMARDLGLPTRIVGCPTLRDGDGLALSSRNVRLSADERARSLAIPRCLEHMAQRVTASENDSRVLVAEATETLTAAGLEVEYVACVDPETLEPVGVIERPTLCLIAARVGSVRLIDNLMMNAGA